MDISLRKIFLITTLLILSSRLTVFSSDLSAVNSWAIQLQNIDIQEISQNNTIDLIVIDYSATGGPEAVFSRQQISQIKNSGKIVLCYLSIGEAETYRWYWQNSWDANHDGEPDPGAPSWLGPANPDWLDNYKVRYWDPGWQAIVFQYLDTIISQGFDGIYMDIVDAYYYWGFMVDEIPDAASRMIQFIQAIKSYALQHANQPFYIFAQNAEAVTDESDVSPAEREAFFAAIDGIGCEGLFFQGDNDENNPYNPDNYRLNLLDNRYKVHGELILSIEYLTRSSKIEKYLDVVQPHGFIPYVSTRPLDTLFDGIDLNDTVTLTGRVYYQDSATPVSGTVLQLSGNTDTLQVSQIDGTFRFEDLPKDGSFTLTARKSGDISEATILSYDAALAARMALGFFPEATVVQQQAADVDLNGQVEMYDAALIARIAIGLPPTSESHASQWIFLPDAKDFPDMANDVTDADFRAIVLGDVDGNWNPQTNLPKPLDSGENLFAHTENNGEITIEFSNDENLQIYSCDLTLRFDRERLTFDSIAVFSEHAFQLFINNSRPGILKIGGFAVHPIENPGRFLQIRFQAKSLRNASASSIEIVSYRLNNLPARSGVISIVPKKDASKPRQFALYQNYPNPFNPTTTIEYELPQPANVTLSVLNLKGEKVIDLVREHQLAGRKSVHWNGCDSRGTPVSSGVYIYLLKAGNFEEWRKMTLFR